MVFFKRVAIVIVSLLSNRNPKTLSEVAFLPGRGTHMLPYAPRKFLSVYVLWLHSSRLGSRHWYVNFLVGYLLGFPLGVHTCRGERKQEGGGRKLLRGLNKDLAILRASWLQDSPHRKVQNLTLPSGGFTFA